LLRSEEFDAVFKNPEKIGSQQLLILFRKNNLLFSRLGLVVAKKQFKKAVTRNYIKRRFREKFRVLQHSLAPIDIVVVPKKGLDVLDQKSFTAFMELQWTRVLKRISEK
jgi:ribonuclease P protein component